LRRLGICCGGITFLRRLRTLQRAGGGGRGEQGRGQDARRAGSTFYLLTNLLPALQAAHYRAGGGNGDSLLRPSAACLPALALHLSSSAASWRARMQVSLVVTSPQVSGVLQKKKCGVR